jgi:hypothetical protein
METTNLWGLLAAALATVGAVLTTYMGRTRTTKQELPEGMNPGPPAPAQQEGTWSVSPEMYKWVQDQMTRLHARIDVLEDELRTERARADRYERLFRLSNEYIDRQDQQQLTAGLSPVPMDPELSAARHAR